MPNSRADLLCSEILTGNWWKRCFHWRRSSKVFLRDQWANCVDPASALYKNSDTLKLRRVAWTVFFVLCVGKPPLAVCKSTIVSLEYFMKTAFLEDSCSNCMQSELNWFLGSWKLCELSTSDSCAPSLWYVMFLLETASLIASIWCLIDSPLSERSAK